MTTLPVPAEDPSKGAATSPVQHDGYIDDLEAARIMARLCSLQGVSVPAHRFGMVSELESGVAVSDLSRSEAVREIWKFVFAAGSSEVVAASKIEPIHYPLLWVANDDTRVLLVKGRLAGGDFVGEDYEHQKVNLPFVAAQQGVFLHLLHQDEARLSYGEKPPQTARDWFFFAIKKHKKVFVEGVIASVLVSVLGTLSALYTMQVYDRVVPHKGYETLAVLTFGVLLAIAFELAMKVVRSNMIDRACKLIDIELSSVFFGKALDIRLDSRPATVGTFGAQIKHFESVRSFMTSSTLFLFADIPLAFFFIAVMALIAGPVALVPLIIAPIAFLVGISFRKPIESAAELNIDENNRRNGILIEAIDGIESVKATGSEWKLLDRWKRMTEKASESGLRLRLMSMLSSNLTQTIQQACHVGIVASGAYLVSQGEITMGALIGCVIINGRAMGPITQIPSMLVQWKTAKVALSVLDNIMAMPGERDEATTLAVPQTCKGQVVAERVSFAYATDSEQGVGQNAIDTVSLAVRPGERIAIIGPVGSGKSTLLKVLAGFFKPSSGRMLLDGVDLWTIAPDFVREHLGYLPQDVRLFNGTLRENLTLGLPSPGDWQIQKAAAFTGLDRIIASHPKGLDLRISEGGKGLSGGQRQLVGLTRMLLAQPKVLFLDEPTASMDNATERRVMNHLFKEIPQESAVILVTHKQALLTHCDRIIVMSRGAIQADGPREKVLKAMEEAEEKRRERRSGGAAA